MGMTTLRIDNMHCGACVRRVTAALNAVPGTYVEQVEVGMARVNSTAHADALIAAVGKAGFPAHSDEAA